MSGINVEIKDGKGTNKKMHLHQKNGDVGLIAYTHDLKDRTISFIPAFNSELGIEMAIDASFGGTPVLVADGTDNVGWTGTNVIGSTVTFDSTDQANTGTKSVKVNKPALNNVWQFDKGSDIDLSNYVALTLFIYVGSGWSVGDSVEIFGFDTGTGLQVGTSVKIETFFNELNFGVWQKLAIPLSSMGLEASTIDALRMQYVSKNGAAPLFYIDDFQVEETSGAALFKVEPPAETKYLISRFNFTFIDAHAGTLADGTMPALSYNKILGLSQLANGILFTLVKNGEVIFAAPIRSISDSIKGGGNLINVLSDGVNTSITLSTDFEEPTILDSREGDFLGIVISDDLSGLISFSIKALSLVKEFMQFSA